MGGSGVKSEITLASALNTGRGLTKLELGSIYDIKLCTNKMDLGSSERLIGGFLITDGTCPCYILLVIQPEVVRLHVVSRFKPQASSGLTRVKGYCRIN